MTLVTFRSDRRRLYASTFPPTWNNVLVHGVCRNIFFVSFGLSEYFFLFPLGHLRVPPLPEQDDFVHLPNLDNTFSQLDLLHVLLDFCLHCHETNLPMAE